MDAKTPIDISSRTRRGLLACLLFATFLAYVKVLTFQFVHDDGTLILQNPFLKSWRYIGHYFRAGLWPFQGAHAPDTVYRPLVLVWFRLNEAVFGLHPWGWHLTTLLAHLGATLAVYFLAKRLSGDWPAALAASAFFGLHPIHIEAVAWVAGGPEPLVALLLISSYLCFLRARDLSAKGKHWWALSLFLFVLATFVKETALVLPLLILAAELVGFPGEAGSGGRPWISRLWLACKRTTPFLLLAAAYLPLRVTALQGFPHAIADVSWTTVILTLPSVLSLYLRLLFWPVGLAPFYDLKFVQHLSWSSVGLPLLVAVAAGIGLLLWALHSRPVAHAVIWLVVPVLPVLNLQILGDGNLAHNRYLYLPSVGFALLLAFAIRSLPRDRFPALQGLLILGLITAYGVGTFAGDGYYANDQDFYTYAYQHLRNPGPVATTNMANVLAQRGDYEGARNLYLQVIKEQPYFPEANYNLGFMDYNLGRLDEAAVLLARAAESDPQNAQAFFYLGLSEFKLDRMAEAEMNLQRATALAPAVPNYHFVLGVVLRAEGKTPQALAEFQQELLINPGLKAAREQIAEITNNPGR